MTVACAALLGPSTPTDGALFNRPLPPQAAENVVPGRVMTWNICNPCDESNVGRAAEIATYAPQLIGLQEACVRDVEKIRAYLKHLYGLNYHVEYGMVLRNRGRCGGWPWRPGAFGQAILSATPMTERTHVEYPDGGSEDRGYMAVTTTVGGRPTRVFNTHLAQRRQEAVRAEQTRVLATAVAPYERAIVLGDFNAVPETPELTGMWSLATDADPQCRPSPPEPAPGTCETTTDWHAKFDYIFLRGELTPLRHAVRPTPYSDHHLLHTDLAPTRTSRRAAPTAAQPPAGAPRSG
ncbi:endonuclease/exonuclease/phosphatase family protein [Streptomyces sp. BG9H]|uniref:Endonuclease/exonuclease/phosphatase family protein n=1 Tax=Streptomyces anatolicus TaxID=2675858 RepID=A0ABS6YPE7_9ACTN|nr:endonuclease/exonuclease/phosphatase family protein [Streptomyces anatolicus]